MISGATYVGVPHTVYSGPSTTVARPKSPSFSDLVPSGYSHTCSTQTLQILPKHTQYTYRLKAKQVNDNKRFYCTVKQHFVFKIVKNNLMNLIAGIYLCVCVCVCARVPAGSLVWCLGGRCSFGAGTWWLRPGWTPWHWRPARCTLWTRWWRQTGRHPEGGRGMNIVTGRRNRNRNWKQKKKRRGHLDELHDQEQLTGRFIHFD